MFCSFMQGAVRLSLTALLLGTVSASAALADEGHAHGAHIGEPGKMGPGVRTIQVMMNDNFYDPESVQVKSGETIRFVLTNKGEFLHEFNIGTAAMHAEHQQEMAMMMEHGMLTPTGMNHDMENMDHSQMGGMDMSEMKHDDPNSVLVEPGKKAELVWKFTQDTSLEFACNIPGHYESGMVGPIDVKS
jgi:uncharacterized cupredoxin-like copper-binding protein